MSRNPHPEGGVSGQILVELWKAEARDQTVHAGYLAALLGVSPGAISFAKKKLKEIGWLIEGEPDRNRIPLRLTDEGRAAARRLVYQ